MGKTKNGRKKVGEVAVETGQVMIIDPAVTFDLNAAPPALEHGRDVSDHFRDSSLPRRVSRKPRNSAMKTSSAQNVRR